MVLEFAADKNPELQQRIHACASFIEHTFSLSNALANCPETVLLES
jgi:hypothetical protein